MGIRSDAAKKAARQNYIIARVSWVGHVSICSTCGSLKAAEEGRKYYAQLFEDEIERGAAVIVIYKAL